jgi:ubiquinol-cytochrome c reductase cytochrome c subunit
MQVSIDRASPEKYGTIKNSPAASLLRVSLRIKTGVEQKAERESRARPRVIPDLLRLCLATLLSCGLAAGQEPAAGAAPDGSAIFSQRCSKCHGERGQGIASAVTIAGPSLQAEHDLGNVMTAVESGPSHMPAFSRVLTSEQIQAVSHYVTTDLAVIPLTQGDIGAGGKIFRKRCAACHRTAVHGGVLAFAGRNAPDLTDKSRALIGGAIRWGPGTMPAFPPSILSDEQLASTVDYVRFVQHPPNPGGLAVKEMGPVAEGGLAALATLLVIVITGWIERGGDG